MRDYDSLEYDALGRIEWVRKTAGSRVVFENFQFEYEGDSNQPNALNNWARHVDDFPFKTLFSHDDKGRLTRISRGNDLAWQYEYDENNNVQKVYFHNAAFSSEDFLARENHTFDDRKKFYANEPALVIFNNYLRRYDPSANNVPLQQSIIQFHFPKTALIHRGN